MVWPVLKFPSGPSTISETIGSGVFDEVDTIELGLIWSSMGRGNGLYIEIFECNEMIDGREMEGKDGLINVGDTMAQPVHLKQSSIIAAVGVFQISSQLQLLQREKGTHIIATDKLSKCATFAEMYIGD